MKDMEKEATRQLEALKITDAEYFLLTTLHEIGDFKFPTDSSRNGLYFCETGLGATWSMLATVRLSRARIS